MHKMSIPVINSENCMIFYPSIVCLCPATRDTIYSELQMYNKVNKETNKWTLTFGAHTWNIIRKGWKITWLLCVMTARQRERGIRSGRGGISFTTIGLCSNIIKPQPPGLTQFFTSALYMRVWVCMFVFLTLYRLLARITRCPHLPYGR